MVNNLSETTAQAQINKKKSKYRVVIFGLVGLSVLFCVFSISFGRAGIVNPIVVVSNALSGTDESAQMLRIFKNIRIPRALASFLVGACLSISGLVYQTTFNNKLVSPDILGVNSGCCVGAGVAILLGLPSGAIRMMAFAFGFFSVIIAIILPKLFRSQSALTLVLSGIIVGSFMGSVLALIKYIADKNDKLADIIFWIMGSLVGVQLEDVWESVIISAIPFIVLAFMGWRINVISLGSEEAESLGVNFKRDRLIIIACATLLTANCVSLAGNVGWVGLVIPHISRALAGDDARTALPVSALSGGLFLMIVDTLSRVLSVNEIPLSIITGFVGAAIYTVVLARKGRYIHE